MMECLQTQHLLRVDKNQQYRNHLEYAQNNQMQLQVVHLEHQILVLVQYVRHHILYLFDHHQT